MSRDVDFLKNQNLMMKVMTNLKKEDGILIGDSRLLREKTDFSDYVVRKVCNSLIEEGRLMRLGGNAPFWDLRVALPAGKVKPNNMTFRQMIRRGLIIWSESRPNIKTQLRTYLPDILLMMDNCNIQDITVDDAVSLAKMLGENYPANKAQYIMWIIRRCMDYAVLKAKVETNVFFDLSVQAALPQREKKAIVSEAPVEVPVEIPVEVIAEDLAETLTEILTKESEDLRRTIHLAKVVDMTLADCQEFNQSTRISYKTILTKFRDYCGPFVSVHLIISYDCVSFLKSYAKDHQPGGVYRAVSALGKLFKTAIKMGYRETNPMETKVVHDLLKTFRSSPRRQHPRLFDEPETASCSIEMEISVMEEAPLGFWGRVKSFLANLQLNPINSLLKP